jgi:tetratricopeptide (TPR) repeat protein
MRLIGAVLAVLMWVGMVRDAGAQSTANNDAKARLLFDNGAMLYEEGRYEDATAAWERAYVLSPRPLLMFNIANAQERVGNLDKAHDALNRYRAFAPAEERAVLDRRIRNLENRIAEEERRRVAPVVTQPVVTETPRTPPPERAPPPAPALEPPRARWSLGVVPITLYSVGAASAVFGTVFALRAKSARTEAEALCTTGDAVYCPEVARPVLKQDRVSSWLADGGFGLAIGCVLAGTTVAVIHKHKASQTNVSFSPMFGGGSLGLSRKF